MFQKRLLTTLLVFSNKHPTGQSIKLTLTDNSNYSNRFDCRRHFINRYQNISCRPDSVSRETLPSQNPVLCNKRHFCTLSSAGLLSKEIPSLPAGVRCTKNSSRRLIGSKMNAGVDWSAASLKVVESTSTDKQASLLANGQQQNSRRVSVRAKDNTAPDCDAKKPKTTMPIDDLNEEQCLQQAVESTDLKMSENGSSKSENRSSSPQNSSEMVFEDKHGRPVFNPRKILILTKLTRLDYEKRTNPDLTDQELARTLKERGSDYGRLVTKDRIHTNYVGAICDELKKRGIEFRLVQRWDYDQANIDWADVIFTAGGDGTFLLAASKIRDRQKPVIGINTDPSGSEGYMCLLKKLPEHKFAEAFAKLLRGEFNWLWRQRIRVTLSGKHAFDDPIELHDQQLLHPEHRWAEHVREYEDARSRLRGQFRGCASLGLRSSGRRSPSPVKDQQPQSRVLPFLALNEVFIGESLSSRVSYYELELDGGERVKQKSSGITCCTGTGSTSWYFNINKLTDQCVADLMTIIGDELGVQLPCQDASLVARLCRRFNDQLIFSPSDQRMAFAVRDPVFNATYRATAPRGFARRLVVKSRCYDAHLVVDGGLSYLFNDGAQAELEVFDDDALRTVVFR